MKTICTVVSCIRKLVNKKEAPLSAWAIERTCRYVKSGECPEGNGAGRQKGVAVEAGFKGKES